MAACVVLIRCCSQRPTTCWTTASWDRAEGAHTMAVRGGRLLTAGEEADLIDKGWRVERPDFGDGDIREFWICPSHNPKEQQ